MLVDKAVSTPKSSQWKNSEDMDFWCLVYLSSCTRSGIWLLRSEEKRLCIETSAVSSLSYAFRLQHFLWSTLILLFKGYPPENLSLQSVQQRKCCRFWSLGWTTDLWCRCEFGHFSDKVPLRKSEHSQCILPPCPKISFKVGFCDFCMYDWLFWSSQQVHWFWWIPL